MSEQSKQYIDKKECSAIGYQTVDVCIPVTVRPFGSTGNIKTWCEGKPVLTQGCSHCHGTPGGVCQFTISQRLHVEVPVIFGARAEVGDASVDCCFSDGDEEDYCISEQNEARTEEANEED